MTGSIREQVIWHKMRKVAKAHPFFRREGGLLTRREARALLRGRELPDGYEVLRQARIELGLSEPIPNTYSRVGHPYKGTRFPNALRWGMASLLALLLVFGFFTMTEVGTTLAENIYKFIVSVFDGSLLAGGRIAPHQVEPIDFGALPAEFESLEAVAEATGRQIIVPGDSGVELDSFSVRKMGEESLVIKSRYNRATDNEQYIISQTLYNDSTLWSEYSSANSEVITIESGIKTEAYLSVMEDGTAYAEMYGEGYSLNINSATMTLDDIQEIVVNLRIAE